MVTRSPTPAFSADGKNFLAALFFAALFFLCSADQFFTTHISGFNVRWGQPILLIAAFFSLVSLAKEARRGSFLWDFHKKLLVFWAPFFAAYGLATLYSPTIKLTFIKWGWAAFNIGLAALVCLNSKWNESLKRGFQYAIVLIAGLIWLEAIAIYWFRVVPQSDPASTTLQVHLGRLFIGYAQPSWVYQGIQFFRPNVFYYEPSYAGSALAFAFPLLIALHRNKFFFAYLNPGIVLGAIILCSSRSGILSALFAIPFLLIFVLFKKQNNILKLLLKILAITFSLILIFSVSPLGLKYIQFINGPLGMDTVQRVGAYTSSEGDRLSNMVDCIQIWSRHLFLGNGVYPIVNGENHGLSQISMNTWLEIAMESGILGIMTFIFSLLATMREAVVTGKSVSVFPFILAAWVSHFLVSLHFTQTFPRLDYWLIFFISISILIFKPAEATIQGK
jgi:hypothetical protein